MRLYLTGADTLPFVRLHRSSQGWQRVSSIQALGWQHTQVVVPHFAHDDEWYRRSSRGIRLVQGSLQIGKEAGVPDPIAKALGLTFTNFNQQLADSALINPSTDMRNGTLLLESLARIDQPDREFFLARAVAQTKLSGAPAPSRLQLPIFDLLLLLRYPGTVRFHGSITVQRIEFQASGQEVQSLTADPLGETLAFIAQDVAEETF